MFSLNRKNNIRNLLLLILSIICVACPNIHAQSPLKIMLKDEVKTEIDYDNKYLLSLSPEKNVIDTLDYKNGSYYPKYTFPSAGSYLCIPQKGYGHNYIIEKMIKTDGALYYSFLPDTYLKAQSRPSVSMLGFSDSSNSANVCIPTAFICVILESNGNKFDNLNVHSTSTPLSGWMMFDGINLHPSPEALSYININLGNNPSKVFFPILPDYTYDIDFKLNKAGEASNTKTFNNIKAGKGEIKMIYLTPNKSSSDSIPSHIEISMTPDSPSNSNRVDDNSTHTPNSEELSADSIAQSVRGPSSCKQCNFSRKTTARELAKSLWAKLEGEEKWAEKQKKNWNSSLPFEEWAGISKNQKGLYNIDIRSGINMDIAVGLATKILENTNYKFPKNSPAVDPTAPPITNRPYGYKAEKKLAIVIDGCQDLNKLVLMNTEITELTIKNCANITELGLFGNSIEKLNIICCPNLTKVAASINRIETLKIDACPEIQLLFCPGNFITELDLSGLPRLEKLNCAVNLLTSLDVTNNINLTEIICYYNLIKKLDLSRIKSLELLICPANDYIKVTPSIDILKRRGLKKYNIEGIVKSKGSNDF